MSAWLFDLGNTRLKCAPLGADGTRGAAIAIPHRDTDVAAALAQVLPARIEVAYLASVARNELRVAVLDALTSRCERISLATTPPRFGGITVGYPQPRQLGVDRFLAMLAAHAGGNAAVLVCGVGTALTIDLLDRDGQHHGGVIAPSPTTMREALHSRAPQLPLHDGAYSHFADNTADALAGGCEGAALGLVERSLEAARSKLGELPLVHLHGGGADALQPRLPGAHCRPDLVLDGLAIWACGGSRAGDVATIPGC